MTDKKKINRAIEVLKKVALYDSLVEQTKEKCQECGGSGEVHKVAGALALYQCPKCHGTGYVYHPERLVIKE